MAETERESTRGLETRNLLRAATTASLATSMAEDGAPYCSLVLTATDALGRPLLLLSDLAVHSRNIAASPTASLLVSRECNDADPLTEARISLQGVLTPTDDELARQRYLRRFPSAMEFTAFTDFNFYVLQPDRAHLVAGFGKINWVESNEFLLAPHFLCDEKIEMDVIEHMNLDHHDAVQLLGGSDRPDWELCGVDPEGVDLRAGWQYRRILFETLATGVDDVRKEIVQLVKNARN